jgi:Barstar (barnase inhibitor)
MSQRLDAILAGRTPAGLYAWGSHMRAARVRRRIAPLGWHLAHLDGGAIGDRGDLLAAIGEALQFPAYYGQNWDALEECITDLAWLPARGYLLLYDQADRLALREPEVWRIACETMREAALVWARQSTPFYILVRGSPSALAGVQQL